MPTQQRRKFSRVHFEEGATLLLAGLPFACQVHDLSLKGALLTCPTASLPPELVAIGKQGVLTLALIVALLATRLRRFAFIIAIAAATLLLTLLTLPALSTASRSVSRSPVSYIKRGSAVAFALLKASARSGRNPTAGITPRPDCLAASSAMRCQRAIFLSASP